MSGDADVKSGLLAAALVAQRLAVSRRMVYALHSAGELPGYRIGKAIRFAASDVDAFLVSCRVVPASRVPAAPRAVARVGVSTDSGASELDACYLRAGLAPWLAKRGLKVARRARKP